MMMAWEDDQEILGKKGMLESVTSVLQQTCWRYCFSQLPFIVCQGGHKSGILRDFSEHGKLREFLGNSVQCAASEKLLQTKYF